ncbi:ABC transporter permease [bacterium]|nr:ABC transporter permease [bacterium]
MNTLFALIKREIDRMSRSKLLLVVMILLPLFFCWISCETFSKGYSRNIPIGVIDYDNSNISRKMTRMLSACPSLSVDFRPLNLEEGKDLILRTKIYALLVIPKDFEKDIYSKKQPQVVSYYNNQYMLIGSMVSKDITAAITTLQTQLAAGAKVKMQNISPKQAVVETLPIQVVDYIKGNPYLNYSYFLSASAFIQIFHIIACFVTIWAFGSEYKEGSAKEWLEKANNSLALAMFSKWLVYFVIFMVLLLLCYQIMFVFYGLPLKGSFVFLMLATAVFLLSYQGAGIAFVEVLGNLRFSLSTGAFYTSLGFTFAGLTYPATSMPLLIKFYTYLIPLKSYLKIFYDQTLKSINPIYDIKPLILMAIIILPSIILSFRLRQMANDSKYWGLE